MPYKQQTLAQALSALNTSAVDAATYLGALDENLSDGDQTVRDILSHLVFWHREYVAIIGSIANGRRPKLRAGKFRELNMLAYREFRNLSIGILTNRLIRLQSELETVSAKLSNTHIKFAFKQGSKPQRLGYWLPRIEAHIAGHVTRLRRIAKKNERSK